MGYRTNLVNRVGLVSLGLLNGLQVAVAETPLAPSLTLETVSSWVEAGKVNSIEELLAHLPESQRTNYTLLYSSMSTQQATFGEPRAILYSNDGSLMMAFNSGNPNHRGGDSVELIQFLREEGRFRFARAASSSGRLSWQWDPPLCQSCHHGRPIWANRRWSGTYGLGFQRYHDLPRGAAVVEVQALAEFAKQYGTHPRYRHLVVVDAKPLHVNTFWERNLHLDALVTDMNAQLIAREIREKIGSDPARTRAMIAAMMDGAREIGIEKLPHVGLGWAHLADYMPSEIADRETLAATVRKIEQELMQALGKSDKVFRDNAWRGFAEKIPNLSFEDIRYGAMSSDPANLAKVIAVAHQLGHPLDWDHWATELGKPGHRPFDSDVRLETLRRYYLQELIRSDPARYQSLERFTGPIGQDFGRSGDFRKILDGTWPGLCHTPASLMRQVVK